MDDPFLHERLLVVQSQLGDEGALGELVARYSPKLRYFIRKLVNDDGACDDIVQETWFEALRGLPKLAVAGAFRTWLYRIARDQAVNWLRRQRRMLLASDAPVAELAADTEEPRDVFSTDDVEAVHAALDALPAEQREVLVLRFLEEMTYEEIARVIQAPVGTVRSRLHYGKLALRAKLLGD